eukprot:11038727-Ditylum_brightwellii.AAC.1
MLKSDVCDLGQFQELAGKLQHASFGIPNGAGLFSPLQMTMVVAKTEVILTPMLRDAIKDWRIIIHHMRKHLTSVLKLVSDFPHYLGYTDACKLGAGGVWASGLKHLDLL